MDEILNILNQGKEGGMNIYLEERENRNKKKKGVKDLTVKPVFNVKDDYSEPPNPNLLRMPFSLLEIAPKGSGKTVLLNNLMMWYHEYFDNIFIWSPTVNLDRKWRLLIDKLRIPEENLFTYYSDQEVSGLMARIKNYNRGKENKDKIRCLFVFDDMVSQLPKNIRTSAIHKLAQNHRHYNISHIIISQTFKGLDPVLRINTTGIILFNTDNKLERAKIIEELSGNYSMIEFEKMYLDTIRQKYHFLYINYDTRKIYDCFDKEIGDLSKEPEYLFKKIERQRKTGIYR